MMNRLNWLVCSICLILVVIYMCEGKKISKKQITEKLADKFEIPGARPNRAIVEEALLEPTQLIQYYGYPAENQSAITKDNYILYSHRIPHGKNSNANKTGIPVVLLHSATCTSTQWLDNGPDSLGFLLADEGYDVWTSNLRCSIFSDHKIYNRSMKIFWDYSLDEQANFDVPALIDDVINKTGYPKIFLIGHSLGSMVSLLSLAANPDYNNKIIALIAMAPVIVPKYLPFLLNPALPHLNLASTYLTISRQYKWLALGPTRAKLSLKACPSDHPILCEISIYPTFGYNPYLRNKTRLPINSYHCAISGISVKSAKHIIQFYVKQNATMLDYGITKNLKEYNASTPPVYNLGKISTPTVIFNAPNDAVANPIDIAVIAKQIPSLIATELFPEPTASHSDYIWAIDAKKFVYEKVIWYLKEFEERNLNEESMPENQS